MNYVVKVKSSCTIYFFYTFGVNTLQCIYVYTNNEILWYNPTYMNTNKCMEKENQFSKFYSHVSIHLIFIYRNI